ncbi:MAG: DNA polymerase III subunit beta [candidate division KSB1 bacterium]|nr:DNA polymerase III subunit beta [candidate division KSB1 bacterium]
MRFFSDRSLLLNALQRVYGVIPSRSTLPLLQNLLLTASDGQLELAGTDLEVSVRTRVELDVEEPGALAIPARLFYEVVRELPEVRIDFRTEGLELVAQAPQGLYRFPGVPKEDFPSIVVQPSDEGVRFKTDCLARILNKAVFAVSTDPLRLALTGVLLHFHDGVLDTVSTDGKKLVRLQRRGVEHAYSDLQAILPTKAVNIFLRNADASADTVVYLAENHAIFDLGSTVVYSKLIAAKYPNYAKVIPLSNEYTMVAAKEDLTAAIRRVSIFASALGRAVQFSFRKDQLTVSAQDIEYGGQGYELLPVEYHGPDMEVAYNGQFLLEILKHIDTERVVFRIQDEQTGALILPEEQAEDEELLMLIMPIRLTESGEA